jgi:hypothetical protein
MADLRGVGIRMAGGRAPAETQVSHVTTQRPLHRALAFTGHSIDDVVNSRIVKNKVLGFYKLHKFVERRCEIHELERQWNPTR